MKSIKYNGIELNTVHTTAAGKERKTLKSKARKILANRKFLICMFWRGFRRGVIIDKTTRKFFPKIRICNTVIKKEDGLFDLVSRSRKLFLNT